MRPNPTILPGARWWAQISGSQSSAGMGISGRGAASDVTRRRKERASSHKHPGTQKSTNEGGGDPHRRQHTGVRREGKYRHYGGGWGGAIAWPTAHAIEEASHQAPQRYARGVINRTPCQKSPQKFSRGACLPEQHETARDARRAWSGAAPRCCVEAWAARTRAACTSCCSR